MVQVQAARQWGKTWTEFVELDEVDRAYMMALVRTEAKMRAWDQAVAHDEMNKARGS